MTSSKGTTTEWARVPPHTARPQTSTQCYTPRCRPHRSRYHRHLHKYHKDIHSSSIYNIYTATCTYATADPGPGSTPKHAVTAAHSAAGHTPSTAEAAHTTATTAAVHTTATAAAAHTTATASSTNCPRFRAAAHTTRQPTNSTTAIIT